MKKVYPVRVTWTDSIGDGGWHDSAEVSRRPMKPTTCVTVGYLLEKKRKFLLLAMSLGGHCAEVHHLLSIPRTAVQKVEKL